MVDHSVQQQLYEPLIENIKPKNHVIWTINLFFYPPQNVQNSTASLM